MVFLLILNYQQVGLSTQFSVAVLTKEREFSTKSYLYSEG